MQVSTGAYEVQVFSVPEGREIKDKDVLAKITYASWTRYGALDDIPSLRNVIFY